MAAARCHLAQPERNEWVGPTTVKFVQLSHMVDGGSLVSGAGCQLFRFAAATFVKLLQQLLQVLHLTAANDEHILLVVHDWNKLRRPIRRHPFCAAWGLLSESK